MANIIKGRKGGSSKQRTPTEQPDDLQSIAKAKILVALGEGEFAGSLTGKDIYLDGTPIENADGSQNFSGVAWEFRPGTQAQNYIQGIPGTENEISVGTDISSQTAWTHTFTNTQLSAIRLRLKWSALFTQEDDGDLVGNTVKYAIDLQTDGGIWQTVVDTSVTGKTTSGYERSHRIDLPQAGSTWTVRLRKITPDANSAKVGDIMSLLSYTEVIDAKLRFPNTALLYIEFDSSQFNGSIPQISCEPRGRVIRVPDNYDPETRSYNGTWTGAFKWAWTDNPAWIFYDLVVTDRFGLGSRLSAANIDKWMLYQVAQYCDQLVPDGKGGDGLEPRYICNVYIQDRNAAYTVLRDFAAIFRGMTFWNGQQIVAQADMPRDIDFTYTRANVIDGKFRYSSSTSKTRYTNALVSWSDPANAYSDAMEPAFVKELVSRYGFNQLELTAIGCTRQSEAHRKGLWGILTNNKDRVITFDVGLDGKIPQPGYIIGVADEMLAGKVNGGRISKVDGRVITLDRDINASAGDRLQLNLPSGTSQSRTIQSINGRRQVTVTTAFSELPDIESVWAIESDELFLQQYRVVGVKDNNNGTYTITGTAHDPDKYARIDTGAIIDQRPVSVVPPGNQAPPDNISLTSFSVVNQGLSVETLQASWDAVKNAIAYEAQWRRNDGNWINVPRSSTTSFEVSGIYAGRYLVRVRAINAAEISSGWAYSEEKTLTGKVGEPLPPLALTTASLTAGIEIRWEFPEGAEDTQRTELQYSPDQDGKGALPLTDLAYPGKKYQQMGLKIATQFWYRARLIDRLGNASPWTGWVHGMSSDNVDDYYQQLDDAIKDTDTYEELTGGIKEVSDSAQAAKDAAQAAQVTADGAVATNKQQQQQLNDQLADIQQNAQDITNAANAGAANASAIAQEILDRKAGDIANANKAAQDVADAIAKAETDDAKVAADAAENLLTAKNEVEAQIETTNITMQDGFDSLSQQMASLAAGTGEQFDSIAIWYYDNSPEGWASNDSNTDLLPVDQDGWVYPAGATSTMRSPNPLAIDARSYKYMRLRMKKVGNPSWAGKMYWIGTEETGWNDARSVSIPEPDFDPASGVTVLSLPDLLWATSGTLRRLRLDFSSNQNADNYFMVDWLAVGRPTPGASQAQIQDLKTAMTAADSAEAAARNTLAVQLRGNYEGTDPAKLVTGIIYNERQTRVTAEQAIASDVNTLRTDYNANKAVVTQRLDTLTSENKSQAAALTQLQSDLTNANGKILANSTAITQLKTDVTNLDGRVTANSQLITGLESTLNSDAIALAANPNNLLTNTGFERKTAAWTGFNAYSDVYAAQVPKSGSMILRGKAGGIASIGQNVANVQKGRTYRYGGWVKRSGDMAMSPNTTGNNKFRLGNADTGTGPLSELLYNATNVGTNWTLFTKDFTASSDMTVYYSVNWILTAGEIYFDDVFFIDVTEEIRNNANASAITGLTTRVTAAEGAISANSQSITQLKGDVSTINGTLSQKADASAVTALQTRVTTAEGQIASQGTAITNLNNGLEAFRRTGENLIQNYDFLQLGTAFSVQQDSASTVTFGAYGDGKNGVRMVRANGTSPGLFANNKKPVPQNGQRRYRYVVRAKGVSGAMNLLMRRWNFNGTVEGSYADKNNTLTTDWQTLTWETDLNQASGVDGAAFGIYCHPSNAEILIDSFKVYDITEEVTIKANSAAITSLTNTVTQNGQDITAQANALTQLKSSLTNDAIALAANPDNMLTNTGFERGTDNWTGFSSLSDVYAAQAPKSGAYILRGKAGGNAAITQNILNVRKGHTYRFGGFAKRTADMTIGPNTVGNNKFRLGNADTGAGPLSELNFSQSNIGTNWTLLTKDYVPSSDMTMAFSINWNLSAGEVYFDDVFFLDVTDEINNAANATAITNLTTRVTSAEGKITSQGTAITQLTADLSTANGKITANANAITSLQSTVTQQGNTLTTQGQAITKLNSDLSDLSGVVDTKASAAAVSELTTRVTNAEGKITANSTALNSITSRVDDAEASIDGLNETTAANGLAMANGFQQLRAQIGDNQAAITQTNKVVADMEKATAEQINTVQSSVNGMSATVQEVSSTVADINGKLGAQWGVKVATDTGGANPRVAGIQLGIDATGSSQFLVQADTFAVYTGGTGKAYPFIVQGGVAYMQEALIRDGSITNAKIGNEIRSNNFVDGSNGWRIAKDGSSQFNNVIVRGRVEANSGVFKGTVQADAFIGDIAVAKGYDSLTLRRNQTVQRNGAYQNRGYSMTVVLACTLVCETYGNGNNQLGYTIDVTFNIGGQQVTRRIYVDAGNIVLGTTAYELRFAARLDADNNKVSFFIKASGRDAVTDYTVSVENITATAFRTDSNSFS
ncbi:TPA: DUF1983 domain-containing protein [Klebsiella quasipneumoniae subsp. quasipneumoniae]|nr:DUF1983 domain-containing protein [Klebsiella quasipneumoniae subsp. quasipneumoniae]